MVWATSTQELEDRIEVFEKTQPHATKPITPRMDVLDEVRKAYISPRLYRRIAQRYPDANEELAYRLARHAYLLDKNPEALKWISKIGNSPTAAHWQSAGSYLQGVMALDQNQRQKAEEHFIRAKLQATRKVVKDAASLALARLAFDQGNYEEARTLYSSVEFSSDLHEYRLEESAWADVLSHRRDLAATEIELLFMLYPDSPRLPESGHLLGRLRANQESLGRGIEALNQMTVRFELEAKSMEKALRKFQGQEELLFSELEPRLSTTGVHFHLPPYGRELLNRDPLIRIYLGALKQVDDMIWDLEEQLALTEGTELALKGQEGTTIESVMFLHWINALEQNILLLDAEKDSKKVVRLSTWFKELDHELNNSDRTIRNLYETARHTWLLWKALSGNRQDRSIEIKQRVRKELQQVRKHRERLLHTKYETEALWLKAQKAQAQTERSRLQKVRPYPEDPRTPFLLSLDKLRTRVERRAKHYVKKLRPWVAPRKAKIQTLLRRAQMARRNILRTSRPHIRKVLAQSYRELVAALARYRWSMSDAKYELFRRTEGEAHKLSKVQQNTINQLEESLAHATELRIPTPAKPSLWIEPGGNVEFLKRIEDFLYYMQATQEYLHEIQGFTNQYTEKEKHRYEHFLELQRTTSLKKVEERRNEAILAYQDFLKNNEGSSRAPYALYRIAQLYYERAKKKEDYELVVPPLQKIYRSFPKFPHRDAALYLLGYTLLETGKRKESSSVFQKLVAEFPRSRLIPEVELRIGEYYFSKRNYAEAIAHYQAVLSFGFNYFYDKALYKLAWANYMLHRYDSAIAHFLILLDYSEELSDERRERFVQFSDEAIEYVAFSMYRSGGRQSAIRVFQRVGWKPYALKILDRLASIQRDRGQKQKAAKTYALAIEKYPSAPETPTFMKHRIALLEETGRRRLAFLEMERSRKLFAANGPWRETNASNTNAYKEADELLEQVTYSMATGHEARKEFRRAKKLYQEVIERFPETRSAYDATFRLAEMNSNEGKFLEAIQNYDVVARNDRFSHYFSEALFAIVVSREKRIQQKGGLDAVIVKSETQPPALAQELIQSIQNFSIRAPRDSRVPEALYRAAFVASRTKQYQKSKEIYLHLANVYPSSPWRNQAFVAAVDAMIAAKEWKEAYTLAHQILEDTPDLSSDLRTKVLALEEGARFKEAEEFAEKKESLKAQQAYLAFQADFPKSPFASKALFNAFIMTKAEKNFDEGFKILAKLIGQYPKAEMIGRAYLERALLLDQFLDIDRAILNYKVALKYKLDIQERATVAGNLALLLEARPQLKNRSSWLFQLAKKLPEPKRGQIELKAADLAKENQLTKTAMSAWRNLMNRKGVDPRTRILAAAKMARHLWTSGKRVEATRIQKKALSWIRQNSNNSDVEVVEALALAESAHLQADRKLLKQTRLNTRTQKTLVRTFKRKAEILQKMEKAVLNLVSMGSLKSSARSLYDLGLAYLDFVTDLYGSAPKGMKKEEFEPMVEALVKPIENKAKDAFAKSLNLLKESRLPEPYLPSLVETYISSGGTAHPLPKQQSMWAWPRIPEAPPFQQDQKPSKSEIAAAPFLRGLVLLAAEGSNRPAAAAEVLKGLSTLKNIWDSSQRREASESFGKAVLLDPTFVPAAYNLAILYLFDGDFRKVEQSLKFLHKKETSSELSHLEGVYSMLLGKWDQAAHHLKEAHQHDPGNLPLQLNWIQASLLSGRLQESMKASRKFIREHPKAAEAYRALAASYRASGDLLSAQFVLKRARVSHPEDISIAQDLALTLERPDDNLLRSSLLKFASRSEHPEALANWATLAFRVGRWVEAEKEWKDAASGIGRYHPAIMANLKLVQTLLEKNP